MNLGVGSPSDNRRVIAPRHSSLLGDKKYNSDNGTPFWVCKVYNGTGSALVANRPYMLTFAGAATTSPNPQVTALAASGSARQIVIAHEAIPNGEWGLVCYQGYHDCGVEGTTDVAAGDYLLVSAGVSTTGLVKDGTTLTNASVAIAMEAQAANSVVDKRVFLIGDRVQSGGAETFTGTVSFGDSTISSPSGGASRWTFTPGAGSNGNVGWALGAGKAIVPETNNQGELGASSLRWANIYSVLLNLSGATTYGEAAHMAFGTSTGTKIGTATTQKIGFYNAVPIVQPSAYTQTFATADKTHAAITATTLTHGVGTADGTVDDVGAAFNQTTLNNNFKECTDRINKLIADHADLAQLSNAIIDDLQALGLVG